MKSLIVTTNSHSHSHSHTEAPSHPHPHADVDDKSTESTRIRRLAMFLEAHFGDVELHMPEEASSEPQEKEPTDDDQAESEEPKDQEPALLITMDDAEAVISLGSLVCHVFL